MNEFSALALQRREAHKKVNQMNFAKAVNNRGRTYEFAFITSLDGFFRLIAWSK